MIKLLEDQFLHWRQDMEKKQEEQARQMKELQERAEHLQCENDRLQAQVEKRHDLDERDAQDGGQAKHLIVRDKGKKPIAFDNVDTPVDDELPSRSSPNPSLERRKRNKDRSGPETLISPCIQKFQWWYVPFGNGSRSE